MTWIYNEIYGLLLWSVYGFNYRFWSKQINSNLKIRARFYKTWNKRSCGIIQIWSGWGNYWFECHNKQSFNHFKTKTHFWRCIECWSWSYLNYILIKFSEGEMDLCWECWDKSYFFHYKRELRVNQLQLRKITNHWWIFNRFLKT